MRLALSGLLADPDLPVQRRSSRGGSVGVLQRARFLCGGGMKPFNGFAQVLISKDHEKTRETSAARVSCVYAVRFMVAGDGPFETQAWEEEAAKDIAKVLKKGGAEKIGIYEVRERHACYEYLLLDV